MVGARADSQCLSPAQVENHPDKPVRIIVPYSPALSPSLQPVFITLDAQPGLGTFERHTMSSIIDIHPHIVSPDTKKYPLDPLGGTQSTWSSERPTTYQMLLDAMDEAEVAKAAIVHSSTAYGYDNSYVADAVAAVPQRFTGVY